MLSDVVDYYIAWGDGGGRVQFAVFSFQSWVDETLGGIVSTLDAGFWTTVPDSKRLEALFYGSSV